MSTRATRADGTTFVAFAAAAPQLAVRLGIVFLRLKAKRRAGVRRFRRALLHGGMRTEDANRLAAEYESIGRLRSYLSANGFLALR